MSSIKRSRAARTMHSLQTLQGIEQRQINRNRGALDMSTYNKESVEKAIKSSAKPISKKEGKLIHKLLKGHS
jgi:hypothetical protein